MIVGGWYVQTAAVWHWYLPSCIYMWLFLNMFYFNYLFPFLFVYFFNLVSINWTDSWTIPVCPNRIVLEPFQQGIGHNDSCGRPAAGPDAFGPNLARPSRSGPGRLCTIHLLSGLLWKSRIKCRKLNPLYTIRPNCGCTLAVTAINCRYQNASKSDQPCLLGPRRFKRTFTL